jgi:DNA modification methylase
VSRVTLYAGDCLRVMPASICSNSIDAIVSDPPYGLDFMGKQWDRGVPGEPFWREALRVAKPGAHLVAFGGTRTYHRLTCAIEDAGWEIRDCLMWLYGSGFPKSLDVSKAIDKAAGAERPHPKSSFTNLRHTVWSAQRCDECGRMRGGDTTHCQCPRTAPATDAARQWAGWHTALKPAYEPIILARKPLAGTVAANVQQFGTGAINVDGCRIGTEVRTNAGMSSLGVMHDDEWKPRSVESTVSGRWPANLILDAESAAALDAQTEGQIHSAGAARSGSDESREGVRGMFGNPRQTDRMHRLGDSGGASRFFYTAKADAEDRNDGCEALDKRSAGDVTDRKDGTAGLQSPRAGAGRTSGNRNTHPTVKPTDLMRWLVRLVTPPCGVVLDPFMGSGSTGRAAALEGCRFIGIELSPEYIAIAEARIAAASRQPSLLHGEVA